MAMKNDFEESSDIHSPFVDEIANRGNTLDKALQAVSEGRAMLTDRGIRAVAARDKAKKAAPKPDTRGTIGKQADKVSAFNAALRAAQGKKDE